MSLPTPLYDDGLVTLYEGDCREILPLLDPVDLIVTDPPYGETSLGWDVRVDEWEPELARLSSQAWAFCSMRMVWDGAFGGFQADGWQLAQDAVWEKHNGSSSASDRLKRVHEHALHLYRGEWGALYNVPPVTLDATARTLRTKSRPPQWGTMGGRTFASEDGGPRLLRSVIYCPSEHGRAIHRTQKPVGVTRLLIEHSCPAGGVVLDPFAGSCTTLVAAKQAGRRAIGIEIDVNPRAVDRIAQEALIV